MILICSPDTPTTLNETSGGSVYIIYGTDKNSPLSSELLIPN